jgi:hypothetical protein
LKLHETWFPRTSKKFMMNSNNKIRLLEILLSEWGSSEYSKLLFFVCGSGLMRKVLNEVPTSAEIEDDCVECVSLHSKDGLHVDIQKVDSLQSTHEQADTRLILHSLFESKSSPTDSYIIIYSPDTDVFVLLLHYLQ